jgi:hypothetical protein
MGHTTSVLAYVEETFKNKDIVALNKNASTLESLIRSF